MDVIYEGHALHKRYPWFGKPPAYRSDKSECPPGVRPEHARTVLRDAIAEAIISGVHSMTRTGDYPKYVWGRCEFDTTDGRMITVVWEACSSSPVLPMYHAYPIQLDRHSDTMPDAVEEMLWPDA